MKATDISPDAPSANFTPGEGGRLDLIATARRVALSSFRDVKLIPAWDMATPFRDLLHQWFRAHDGHLIHGAVAALFVFHLSVAATIGKGTVDPAFVDHFVIFGALMGALAWNIITWYYGIPSSSSHALVGGLVGATVAKAGSGAPIVWAGFGKILAFIIISPLVGFFIGGMLMVLVAWVFRNQSPHQAGKWFRSGQLFAAAAYSLGHGGR